MTLTFRLPGPLLLGGSLLILASLYPAPAWATSITDIVTDNTPVTVYATYDSSITGDSKASTIETTINAAIREIESYIYNPMTVYITFDDPTVSNLYSIGSDPGANDASYYPVNYSTYITQLFADGMGANDTAALAHLSSGATVDPVIGASQIAIKAANADALGINIPYVTGTFSSTNPEGDVYLNIPKLNLSRSGSATGLYDLETVAMHEIDEVLGLGSSLDQSWSTTYITPEDLFRYNASNARVHTAATTSYFEITPGTKITQLNSTAGNDYGDWATVSHNGNYYYNPTGSVVYIQDAIGTTGTAAQVNMTSSSPELTALDVIGYDLEPEPSTWSLLLAGAIIVFFARRRIARRA